MTVAVPSWKDSAADAGRRKDQARARAAEAGHRAAQLHDAIAERHGKTPKQRVSDHLTAARAVELALESQKRNLAAFQRAANQHDRLAAWHEKAELADDTRATWHHDEAARHRAAASADRARAARIASQ
jgi:hypothetical protein